MWFPKMLMVVAITSSRVCSEIQWSYERAHALRELMYVCSAKKKKRKKEKKEIETSTITGNLYLRAAMQ